MTEAAGSVRLFDAREKPAFRQKVDLAVVEIIPNPQDLESKPYIVRLRHPERV
jgi:hypothetical protein